jgi:hypothetical protein
VVGVAQRVCAIELVGNVENNHSQNDHTSGIAPTKYGRVRTPVNLMTTNGAPPTFSPVGRRRSTGVYEKFTQIADELSAILRYITGSERPGGAGRTTSGLAMLMGNAAKILQTVAANIDGDIVEPSIDELYTGSAIATLPIWRRLRSWRRSLRISRTMAVGSGCRLLIVVCVLTEFTLHDLRRWPAFNVARNTIGRMRCGRPCAGRTGAHRRRAPSWAVGTARIR